MSPTTETFNRRILVIDDSDAIHQDFQKILSPCAVGAASLAASEAALFGDVAIAPLDFELSFAHQGQEGLAQVVRALSEGRPYALAFVDMRMPPGWDGLETIEHLWQVDPQLQIALCTAHSDYSWETLSERLQLGDRLLILKKPFDNIEIRQMATALTAKWQATKEAAFKMSYLEQAVEERTRELSDANIIIQHSPTILYRLRGEPSFPLIYISNNITKFGHDPATLVASPEWAKQLIDANDQPKVDNALAQALENDVQGASIEFRLRTGDGGYRWVENRYHPVRDKDKRLVEVEGIIIDITERKAAEEKISQLARTDGLTGLANRTTFIEHLRQSFAASERGGPPFAILYLDLDHFKPVNDTLGHPIGDLLLTAVADRLDGCMRESDIVARLGGDEFAVLQLDVDEPANAGMLASKILTVMAQPYLLGGNEVRISASIGICPYSEGSTAPDIMLAQADVALYRSKDEGGNCYHFYSDDLDQAVLDRITLSDDLKLAIARGEMELHYQPQVELTTGAIVGMEALVRWHHSKHGLLAAATFIPMAEKTGAIVSLGQWVLDQACRQMRRWRDEGIAPPVIAINLSFSQLRREGAFVNEVARALSTWGLAPSDIEFDVTEATLAKAKWAHNDVLGSLRDLGVRIAIDDFGTEYSSFEYLRAYSVNHIKIAPALISNGTKDPDSAATIRAIINLAREVRIGIIVEGVETEEQRALLLSTGCAVSAQGNYFGEAAATAMASAMLREDGCVVRSLPDPEWTKDAP